MTINNIEDKARNIRENIVNMIYEAGSGHPGGSLSCVDILVVLYFYEMRHNPYEPKLEDRDIFILSKGHAAPALYATLAECGYFPIEELSSLRKFGNKLQGHVDHNVPGIEISTGSLGQGLSVACGIALAGKTGNKNFRVYVLLGDGECDEGQVWEAAMFAHHYKLDNLVAIIDRNSFQIDGLTEDIMSLEPILSKWESFGWNVVTIDGHNISEIITELDNVKNVHNGKPSMIIAYTIKGKGVSIMEKNNKFHGIAPTKEEMAIITKELWHKTDKNLV